ncbi:ABC transporter ATP-binding protein [Dongia sedimenti]|uniref:ABC transporter ATP-binding protein n=1 Tax=Dongia sedimenti TaxID=3064282 RepID=A0ABU0YPZ8_9PROT|nr:ABC transporter ATP-binding protein [Rhodospirillaceae bacterium R-7]
MIDIADLRLTLASDAGPVNILNGLNLKVAAKESLGIVGPSGSGKTSLMLLLAGLEQASGGRIRLGESEITAMSEDQLALYRRGHIGIVFQAFHLIPTMTALENVATPLELSGEKRALEIARGALDEVGLGHRLGHYPSQLSGGEQQRVALARAMAPQPDLLLADEPTGNLDTETGQKVIELLFGMQRRRGATLLLITHDPALARRCDRIIHLADGRIVSEEVVRSQAAAK